MRSIPRTLGVVRVLMFAVAGLTIVTTAGFLLANGVSVVTLGYAAWGTWPGAASLVLALRVRHGGRWLRPSIVALQIAMVLLALARLGAGDPCGVPNLILPIVILVLVTRPSARAFFRDPGHALAY